MLVGNLKDNYYVRFHNPSFHLNRKKKHISILLDMKFCQYQWSMKCRSMVPGHGVCLLSMSKKIIMQGFLILAIIGTDKDTLVFYLT